MIRYSKRQQPRRSRALMLSMPVPLSSKPCFHHAGLAHLVGFPRMSENPVLVNVIELNLESLQINAEMKTTNAQIPRQTLEQDDLATAHINLKSVFVHAATMST